MNAQNPDINPISYGSHFAIDYSLLLHDPDDIEIQKMELILFRIIKVKRGDNNDKERNN
jgi:hypothetical protein